MKPLSFIEFVVIAYVMTSCKHDMKPSAFFYSAQLDSLVEEFIHENAESYSVSGIDVCFNTGKLFEEEEYYQMNVDTIVTICVPGSECGVLGPMTCLGSGNFEGVECSVYRSGRGTSRNLVPEGSLTKHKTGLRHTGQGSSYGYYKKYSYHRHKAMSLLGINGYPVDGRRPRPFSQITLFTEGCANLYKDSCSTDIIGGVFNSERICFAMSILSSSSKRFKVNVYLVDDMAERTELRFLFKGWIEKRKLGGYLDCDGYSASHPMLKLYSRPDEHSSYSMLDISHLMHYTFMPVEDYAGNDWFRVNINHEVGWTRNVTGPGGFEGSFGLRYSINCWRPLSADGIMVQPLKLPVFVTSEEDDIYIDSYATEIVGHIPRTHLYGDIVMKIIASSSEMFYVNTYLVDIDNNNYMQIYLFSGWINKNKVVGYVGMDEYENGKMLVKLYSRPTDKSDYSLIDMRYYSDSPVMLIDYHEKDWFKLSVGGSTGWTRNVYGWKVYDYEPENDIVNNRYFP